MDGSVNTMSPSGEAAAKPAGAAAAAPRPRSTSLVFAAVAIVIGFAAGMASYRVILGPRATSPVAAKDGAADTASTDSSSGAPSSLPAMAVVSATRAAVSREEVFTGEFRPFDEVELRPEVAGFLKSITVDEGDHVTAGEVLAVLEVPGLDDDIARSAAQIERDKASADTSQANRETLHQTWQRMSAVGAQDAHLIAQQDLDEAKQHDDAAQATWQAAISQVKISTAEHQRLLTLAGFRTITAPFAGIVTARHADPGTLVQGGVSPGAQSMPLVTLSRNDVLRLSFPVVESLVPRIEVGSPLTIRISALAEELKGTVSRFTRKLDERTRTMEVEADIPNADLRITPGMYADVSFTAERHADVVALPPQTLKRRGQAAVVYVVGPDHRIEERQVTLGLEGADLVEISSGLHEGDQVVFGRLDEVKAGMTIDPRPLTASFDATASRTAP
jgi:RND family efflux transporter MFP subunit